MHFLYQISPAAWFKIGLFSLLLGVASAWHLYGAKLGLPKITLHPVKTPPGIPANGPANSPESAQQLQAIAPVGILDQYVEFDELLVFEDSVIKTGFVLQPAVAPSGILDAAWTG